MIVLNAAQKIILGILNKEKGPRALLGLQVENPGKIAKKEIEALVKKGLVRTRKGYHGRGNRYEIRAAGRTLVNAKLPKIKAIIVKDSRGKIISKKKIK